MESQTIQGVEKGANQMIEEFVAQEINKVWMRDIHHCLEQRNSRAIVLALERLYAKRKLELERK